MGKLAPAAAVGAAVLVYSLASLAHGWPRFPTRAECVHPARDDGAVVVVFGYRGSTRAAEELQARAERSGFSGLRVERNACGLVRVALHGVPSPKVGREVQAEAKSVGIDATLEQES